MAALRREAVRIPVPGATLHGDVALPEGARGLVLFAHGSGSSRHSPRNRYVADVLHGAGLGSLLMDLLTSDEERIDERTAELRFDVQLLAERLIGAAEWARVQPDLAGLGLGLFGASTGAAAALIAAAERPDQIRAVVSRGGRPDLAGDALPAVRAPTLLVVGGADEDVLELNRQALDRLRTTKELSIVPGATHLFEERGALERVAELGRAWFLRYVTWSKGGSDAGSQEKLS